MLRQKLRTFRFLSPLLRASVLATLLSQVTACAGEDDQSTVDTPLTSTTTSASAGGAATGTGTQGTGTSATGTPGSGTSTTATSPAAGTGTDLPGAGGSPGTDSTTSSTGTNAGAGGALNDQGMGGAGNLGGAANLGSGGTPGVDGAGGSGPATDAPPWADASLAVLLNCGNVVCHVPRYILPDLTDIMGMQYETLLNTTVEQCGNAPLVKPGDPDNSALLMLPTRRCGDFVMPEGCPDEVCLWPEDMELLRAWIAAGAPR